MKKRENLKTTTNRRVYNILYKWELVSSHGLCPYCGFHTGCNFWNGPKPIRNWKYWRKQQYKQKKE